jgi:soluble P-type ATPase
MIRIAIPQRGTIELHDAAMLRLAAIGIAVLSHEGMALSTLQAADVLTHGPVDAMNLLLHPKRLISTLRG